MQLDLLYIISLKVKVIKNLLMMSNENVLYATYAPFDYIAYQLEPI